MLSQINSAPTLTYCRQKSHNSAMKNQCWWRFREREWGGGEGEKVMYSIILLKEDLDNRWITAVCRYKGNRGWQRHQERSEKNSFNEYVTCTCMSKLCSCHLLQSTLKSLGFENSENGDTDDELLRSKKGKRHFRVLAVQ